MTNEDAAVITREKNGRVFFGRLEFAIQALILLSLLASALSRARQEESERKDERGDEAGRKDG